MNRKRVLTLAAVLAVPVLIVAWWLGSPLFLDRTVDETLPLSATAAVPSEMRKAEVEAIMQEAAATDDAPLREAMPVVVPEASSPEAVKRGEFRDADDFHTGSGTATIYRLDDGSYLLRLEDFRVTNGPDLRVLLSSAPDVESREQLHDAGYIELAKLKGNVGNQNYEITEDTDVASMGSVIIYCKPFQVLFSVAPLLDVETSAAAPDSAG